MTTHSETDLRRALALLAISERFSPCGREYAGPHDFVLREGTWYVAPTEPHKFGQGAPRSCFGNAINGAVLFDLAYVEGYALNAVSYGEAFHHSWNVDRDGNVVDLTWGAWRDGSMVAPIGVAYCGVEFSVERADDASWNGDASVLVDEHRGWPIFQSKWNGEPPGATWPHSPRLDALRAAKRGDLHGANLLLAAIHEPQPEGA